MSSRDTVLFAIVAKLQDQWKDARSWEMNCRIARVIGSSIGTFRHPLGYRVVRNKRLHPQSNSSVVVVVVVVVVVAVVVVVVVVVGGVVVIVCVI